MHPYVDAVSIMASVLSPDRDAFILDYGCGDGTVRDEIVGMVWDKEHVEIHGMDVDLLRPEKWYRADLADELYDLVVCFDVLEHCEYPRVALNHIWHAMRPGATLLITVPNRWWLFETHAARPFNRLPFFNWGPWRHWLRRKVGRDVPCYTKKQLHDALSPLFDVKFMGYMTAPMDNFKPLRGAFWKRHYTMWPFMATNIYAVCKIRGGYRPSRCRHRRRLTAVRERDSGDSGGDSAEIETGGR